jgi:hypothetical protein
MPHNILLAHLGLTRCKKRERPTDLLYTPAVPLSWRRERPFAPAMDHSRTSSLATRRAACTLGAAPLKTQEFLCFQITHTPRMTKELKPLQRCSCTREEEAHHQSSKTPSVGCGTSCSKPTGWSKPAQTCLAKTQEVRRWLMVSGSWSHSGH